MLGRDLISRRDIHLIVSVFYRANTFSIHAEKNAIMQVKNKHRLRFCKIIIIKITNGIISYATPCQMCIKLLKKYGLTKIYTIDNGKIVKNNYI